MIAVGECAQFIVLGPIVADLAPPHLLGRYMSLYGLTFTAGVALGPAVGGALLATSPDAVWWGGALAAALIGAGLLRLGDRIPDPLLQAQCPPPQADSAADMGSACHSEVPRPFRTADPLGSPAEGTGHLNRQLLCFADFLAHRDYRRVIGDEIGVAV